MQKLNLLLLALLLIGCSHADPLDVSRLKLSEGFHISIFSQAPGARFMTFTPGGVLLVSDTNDGTVLALPDPQHSGKASRTVTALQELNAPHGLAFHNGKLYVAETDKVSSFDWNEAQLRPSNPRLITNLPRGGAHFTRTILFANGKLYVSVGSDCNICVEKDERRAAVLEMNDDGSAQHIFARGLRNAVGLAFNSRTGTVWAGDNGRDWLGDNLPPEEVNDLGKNGGDFGWPYCYGDRHPNPEFRAAGEKRCPSTIPPKVEMQAHGAPLGIAFYSGSLFPKEYEGDLFVALHGSWNRSALSGFKVVHIKIGPNGEPQGGAEDFITGWVKPGEKKDGPRMGRPVAVLPGPDGALYVSDDTANVVYRVTYGK